MTTPAQLTGTALVRPSRASVHVARRLCEVVDDYLDGYEPDLWSFLPTAASWPTPSPMHDLDDKEASWN